MGRTMQNNGPRYTKDRKVAGMLGVIIYPDNYNGSEVSSDLLATDWAPYEAAGCVFLPAAGYRNYYNTQCKMVGSYGAYWSATLNTGYPEHVYYVEFSSIKEGGSVLVSNVKNYGYPVRLVISVE